jgi:hypothetical protein
VLASGARTADIADAGRKAAALTTRQMGAAVLDLL